MATSKKEKKKKHHRLLGDPSACVCGARARARAFPRSCSFVAPGAPSCPGMVEHGIGPACPWENLEGKEVPLAALQSTSLQPY
jgi:hypothetical protein